MPTKGLATRLEAIELTKAGALDEGAAVAGYLGGDNLGNVFAKGAATDNNTPMVATVYNASTTQVVLIGVSTTNSTTTLPPALYKVAVGASKRVIADAGWYLYVWGDGDAETLNIESYNTTWVQADNR